MFYPRLSMYKHVLSKLNNILHYFVSIIIIIIIYFQFSINYYRHRKKYFLVTWSHYFGIVDILFLYIISISNSIHNLYMNLSLFCKFYQVIFPLSSSYFRLFLSFISAICCVNFSIIWNIFSIIDSLVFCSFSLFSFWGLFIKSLWLNQHFSLPYLHVPDISFLQDGTESIWFIFLWCRSFAWTLNVLLQEVHSKLSFSLLCRNQHFSSSNSWC